MYICLTGIQQECCIRWATFTGEAGTAETIGMSQFRKGNHDAAMSTFHVVLEVKKEYQGNNTIYAARTLNNFAIGKMLHNNFTVTAIKHNLMV
eukprot:2534943-Ditylum_brightwellii.AAC.1